MAAKTKTRSNWLLPASRILWWALFLLFLAVYGNNLITLLANPQAAFDLLLVAEYDPQAVASAVAGLGWSTSFFIFLYILPEVLTAIAFLAVGLLIGMRKSGDWFTWFISLWMVVFGLTTTSTFTLGVEQFSDIGAFYAIPILFSYAGIAIFLFTFPDGTFQPRWTRFVALAWVIFIVSTVVVQWFAWDSDQAAFAIVPFLAFVLYSQVYRYRAVSTVAEKEQTKWLIGAIGANGILIILSTFFASLALLDSGSPASVTYILLSNAGEFIANLLLVVAVSISILRYRLWDIEVVVNRALIYGPMSLILAGVFAASVVIFNQSTRQLFGAEDANTSAVISALIVATVFTPVRSRIEGWINRKLYADQTNLARELVEISDPRFALSAPALTKLVAQRIPAVMNSDAGGVYLPAGARAFKQAAATGRKLPASFSLDAKARAELAGGKVSSAGPAHLLVPLYVPRLRSKELMGVLALGLRKNGRGYSSDDKHALAELGAQVGTALYAAQMRRTR
jgi:hypothetical protein